MSDEQNAATTLTDQDAKEQDQPIGLASETDLKSVFQNEASPLDEDPAAAEEEAKTAVQTEEQTPQDDPRIAEMEQRLSQINDRLVAEQTRGNILQDRLNKYPQQQTQVEQEAPYDLTKFREEVAKDPATAIFSLFERAQQGQNKQATAAAEQARNEAIGVVRAQNEFESDRGTAMAEYGQLLKDNKEFSDLASQVYDRYTANSPTGPGGNKWHPGAIYAAMSIAYAQLAKNGKLTKPVSNVTQLTRRPTKPSNPLLGNDNQADTPRGEASNHSAKDLAIMKKTASSMGITLDRYLKIMEDLKKSDPHFGSGL